MEGVLGTALPFALSAAGLLALVRTRKLRQREPGIAPLQRLGILLVATPILVLLLIGSWAVPSLAQPSQVAPLPTDQLTAKTAIHLGLYLAMPLAGLALILKRSTLAVAYRTLVPGPDRRRRMASGLGWAAGVTTATVFGIGAAWGLGQAYGGGILSGGGAAVIFSETTLGIALLLAGVAAVAEELLFRGVLLEQLTGSIGRRGAIALQAIAFGLIHAGYGSMVHVGAAVAFGILMGILVVHRGLLPAILTHFLVNAWILGLWTGQGALIVLVLAALALVCGSAVWLAQTHRSSGGRPSPA